MRAKRTNRSLKPYKTRTRIYRKAVNNIMTAMTCRMTLSCVSPRFEYLQKPASSAEISHVSSLDSKCAVWSERLTVNHHSTSTSALAEVLFRGEAKTAKSQQVIAVPNLITSELRRYEKPKNTAPHQTPFHLHNSCSHQP